MSTDADAWRGVAAEQADDVTPGLAELLRSRSRRLLGDLLRPHRREVIVTISETVVMTARRYGRSRSPSRCLLRSRSSAARPALTSSAFSVATPRQVLRSAVVTRSPPVPPRP